MQAAIGPLQLRIAELELQLKELQLAGESERGGS